MARFLFAATPAAGHVNPGLPLVRALVDAGHTVRFTAGRAYRKSIERAGATFVPLPLEIDFSDATPDERWPERAALSGIRKLQWDIANFFVAPMATHVRHLRGLLTEEPVDAIVADSAYGAALLLRELGGPPVVLYGVIALSRPSRDLPPFGLGFRPMGGPLGRLRNGFLNSVVRRAVFGPSIPLVDDQRAAVGLPPARRTAVEFSVDPALHLQLSPAGFEYPRTDLPSWVRFIGHPAPIAGATPFTPPAWWPDVTDTAKPVVVVSQGTIATDPSELLRPALTALADQDVLVVAVTGGADPAVLGDVPANARVADFVPFGALFPHASLVVTNGGYGTVQLALSHGLPLVVAGKTEDKAETTARVAWSGVGVNLNTQTPTPEAIRTGVAKVLSTPHFAERARELRDETAGVAPAARAVTLLEGLVTDMSRMS